jgi:hypothetical protein
MSRVDPNAKKLSMKPALATLVEEAVRWAITDCARVPDPDKEGGFRFPTDDERREWVNNPYSIPSEVMQFISPDVLSRNVANRLLGVGGWFLPTEPHRSEDPEDEEIYTSIYTGNATTEEIWNATFARGDVL